MKKELIIKKVKLLRLNKKDIMNDIIKDIQISGDVPICLMSDMENIIGTAKCTKIKNTLYGDLHIKDTRVIDNIKFHNTASIAFKAIDCKINKKSRIINDCELIMVDLCEYNQDTKLNGNLK